MSTKPKEPAAEDEETWQREVRAAEEERTPVVDEPYTGETDDDAADE